MLIQRLSGTVKPLEGRAAIREALYSHHVSAVSNGVNMVYNSILVVGAGLAGAVYARELAEAGLHVQIIDLRPHIAGNAYDEIGSDGVRIHRYGPHLFHTANTRVLDYVRRYGVWTPYVHRVRAVLPSGGLAPLPINLDTINLVFGLRLRNEEEVRAHLAAVAESIDTPRNAAEYLASKIGIELRDLFFRPYTKKMWELDLEDLDADVVKRLPLRFDRLDTYFSDNETQILPVRGYTDFVARILDHKKIKISLSTPFNHGMLRGIDFCFASLPIDEYYDYSEGELPYRSIRFHHRSESQAVVNQGVWASSEKESFSVLNFTDDGPFTRETAWHRLPNHIASLTSRVTLTREEPCDYRDNGYERYYPVRSANGVNDAIYDRYKLRAEQDQDRIMFIGRCGMYRYLDMDQVINQSLMGARKWLSDHRI